MSFPCQTLMTDIDELVPVKVPPEKAFYPYVKIRGLLSADRISDILSCCCPTCGDPPRNDPTRVLTLANRILSESCVLFALLSHCGRPQLIEYFIQKGWVDKQFYGDIYLEESKQHFTIGVLATFLATKPRVNSRNKAQKLAGDIFWGKFHFFLPELHDGDEEVFICEHARLPFIEERPLGKPGKDGTIIPEGASSEVFKFEVEPGYNHIIHVKQFARKVILDGNEHGLLEREKYNLRLVKSLNNDHIVRVLAILRYRGKTNFIFEYAETNLSYLLRHPHDSSFNLFSERIEEGSIWPQLVGITKALHRITNPEVNNGREMVPYFGYHLDLKPLNILVKMVGERTSKLMICDFGRANFMPQKGASNVSGLGGTFLYAPPEIFKKSVTRKYDVWSLGCIFLEVLIYAVGGPEELEKFANERFNKTESSTRSESYFRKRRMSYDINLAAASYLEKLPKSSSIKHDSSRNFVIEMCALVKKMLTVDVIERPTAECVHDLIDHLVRVARPVQHSNSYINSCSESRSTEVSATKEGHIFEDSCSFLYLSTSMASKSISRTERHIGDRSNVSVSIPDARATLKCLINVSNQAEKDSSGQSSTNILEMKLSTWREAILLQSSLLGQRLELATNVSIEIVEKKYRLSKHSQKQLYHACQVQLWSEQSSRIASFPRRNSPRSISDFVRGIAAPRRIVMHCGEFILIIPISKTVRIEAPETPSRSRRIVPTNPKNSPIEASRWQSEADKENWLGLPLDRQKFRDLEERYAIDLASVTLLFGDDSDAKSFSDRYWALKKLWSKETESAKAFKSNLGEMNGYGV